VLLAADAVTAGAVHVAIVAGSGRALLRLCRVGCSDRGLRGGHHCSCRRRSGDAVRQRHSLDAGMHLGRGAVRSRNGGHHTTVRAAGDVVLEIVVRGLEELGAQQAQEAHEGPPALLAELSQLNVDNRKVARVV
jgi:hypothetical protein